MSEVGPDGETKFKMIGPTGNYHGYSKARSGAYRFGFHPRSEGGVASDGRPPLTHVAHKRRRDADASDEAPAAKRRRCPKLSEDEIIAIFSKRLAELEKAEHEAARAKEAAAAAAAAGAAAAAKAAAAAAAAEAAAAADAAAAAAAVAAATADAAAAAVATAKVVAVTAAASAAKTAALQAAEALAGKEA
ncbi:unnamed protein product, partial [Ectocarpus sp. 12 AP-2014]